jgi:hypothetical protein
MGSDGLYPLVTLEGETTAMDLPTRGVDGMSFVLCASIWGMGLSTEVAKAQATAEADRTTHEVFPHDLTLTPAREDSDRPLYLQVVNPADKMRGPDQPFTAPAAAPSTQPAAATPLQQPNQRLRSFELPPVEVVGERPAELREEERVGPNEQPRWTANRRFPGTRIYVLPPEQVEFEFWLRPTVPRDGKTQLRSLYELEFGLPSRFQLDLYLRTESETDGPTRIGESIELRYAFAEWNRIWGNPTIYVEWSRLEDESDAIEVKLLLGGEIAPRWHWGVNFSDELSTGGDRANEIEITARVSYTLADSRFSIGLETECGVVDTKDHRGTFDEKFFFLGPSMQFRATEQFHIDFAPLVGLTGDSPAFRVYLVIGYEF